MNQYKQILITILVITLSISLFSFTSYDDSQWKKFKSLNEVTVYYKTAECKLQNNNKVDYFVFKYVNDNQYDVKVSYKLNLWIGENCRSCDLSSPNEYEIEIVLQAGQTLEYSCGDDNKGLKLYKPEFNAEYNNNTKFEFENFQVLKTQ